MAILDRIKRVFIKEVPSDQVSGRGVHSRSLENPEYPLTSANLVKALSFRRTSHGRTVTIDKALSLTPINAAIRVLTETMSSLQLEVEGASGLDGKPEPADIEAGAALPPGSLDS